MRSDLVEGELARLADAVNPLVAANAAAQRDFIDALAHAFAVSGRSVEDVARILGTDVAAVVDALSGVTDLTLTETRYLAQAVDAYVRYQVTPSSALSPKMPSPWTENFWRTTKKPGALNWPRLRA